MATGCHLCGNKLTNSSFEVFLIRRKTSHRYDTAFNLWLRILAKID